MLSRRSLLLASALLAPMLLLRSAEARPLWPGARYTDADRAQAIRRGLRFLHRLAMKPKNFAEHGDDLLWCFYTISITAADPELKDRAWQIGKERAQYWRRKNTPVPAGADGDDLTKLVSGALSADRMGVGDDRMKEHVQQAAARLGAEQFLQFDPTKEPVPRTFRRRARSATMKTRPAPASAAPAARNWK